VIANQLVGLVEAGVDVDVTAGIENRYAPDEIAVTGTRDQEGTVGIVTIDAAAIAEIAMIVVVGETVEIGTTDDEIVPGPGLAIDVEATENAHVPEVEIDETETVPTAPRFGT
jgi:hypothetical protein